MAYIRENVRSGIENARGRESRLEEKDSRLSNGVRSSKLMRTIQIFPFGSLLSSLNKHRALFAKPYHLSAKENLIKRAICMIKIRVYKTGVL